MALPRRTRIAPVLPILASLCGMSAASAATFQVTTTDDSGPGSLREAILAANAAPGVDIISITANGTLVLQSALPILAESASILGPGAHLFVIDGDGAHRPFRFGGVLGSSYELLDIGLRNGWSDSGGAVLVTSNANLVVRRCHLEGNVAEEAGGAIRAVGSLSLIDSVVQGNSARFGGGVAVADAPGLILGSSIVLNSATQGGGLSFSGAGERQIENSTIAGNMADDVGTAMGGGIALHGGTAILRHVTLAFNTADFGSGLARQADATVTLIANSILAHNRSWEDAPDNCFQVFATDFGNLSSDLSCQFGGPSDLISTDPALDEFGQYGGPTPTFRLRADSPARDSALGEHCLAFDQRGVARPHGEDCDRGAVEYDPTLDSEVVFASGFEA